jgi:copper transport protein
MKRGGKHAAWRRVGGACLLLALALCTLFWPLRASAHAVLLTATPEPNSRMAESPPSIVLTFNERLDDGLFYIKVFDVDGKEATSRKAVMDVTHTSIRLDLPKLQPGGYLITYHIISADGHPVSGSYPLAIGGTGTSVPAPAADPAAGSHHHGLQGGIGVKETGQYLSRAFFYATLLASAGWAFWLRRARRREDAAWKTWTTNTLRVHLLAILFMIATHAQDYIGTGGLPEVEQLFTSTAVGLNWLALLALAVIGLAAVGRAAWFDYGWGAAVLLVKSISGHAMAASDQPWPVVSDAIHLTAAALWVGGMWTLIAMRRIDPDGFMPLLRRFSGIALASIVVLFATGTLMTLFLLPNLHYVLYSEWGYVLLGKVALVILVVIVAAWLRLRLKAGDPNRLRGLMNADISLMAAIVLLVGVLTYLPPKPANEPFYWHQMGTKLHVTATITPNVPGVDNSFAVTVWLPKEAGAPKQVRLQLENEDNKQVAPIAIPVELYEQGGSDTTYGGDLLKYSYSASGHYLPFAGDWKLVVTVRDQNDDETQTEKAFRVY